MALTEEQKAYYREYYQNHKEQRAESARKWRQTHQDQWRELCRKNMREWRARNPERAKEIAREQYAKRKREKENKDVDV